MENKNSKEIIVNTLITSIVIGLLCFNTMEKKQETSLVLLETEKMSGEQIENICKRYDLIHLGDGKFKTKKGNIYNSFPKQGAVYKKMGESNMMLDKNGHINVENINDGNGDGKVTYDEFISNNPN